MGPVVGLVSLAVLFGCCLCGAILLAPSMNRAHDSIGQTRVAEQPPTETALPLRPTATTRPISEPTDEAIIVNVGGILGYNKEMVNAYLGQPISDDPIPNDDDQAPGGTMVDYSITVDEHEIYINMDFDRRDRVVFIALWELDAFGIPLDEWPRMAARLHIPFKFDDTPSCNRSFTTGPYGRHWNDCHTCSFGFNAVADSPMITEFFIGTVSPCKG